MPARVVTATYPYRRPPRKKKPVLLEVPAIVVKRNAEARPIVRGVKLGNDDRPVEQPVAIVTNAAWTDDGGETPKSVKAFLARMAARQYIAARRLEMRPSDFG